MSRILSSIRGLLCGLIISVVSVILCILITEFILRLIDKPDVIHGRSGYEADPVIGWLPPAGRAVIHTGEFTSILDVNEYRMNEGPHKQATDFPLRILALGDSHTFAVGVDFDKTWPNVLEASMFNNELNGTVYNAGVVGYNLGQYLLRYRSLKELTNPHYVIVGLSAATDIYDLIPRRKGGFVYGAHLDRTYFDLNSNGELEEKISIQRTAKALDNNISDKRSLLLRLKDFLDKSKLYSKLKRLPIAYYVALKFSKDGSDLIPGLNTSLKIKARWTSEDSYRWSLAEAILNRLNEEINQDGKKMILVHIPYMAQAYDNIWKWSFGVRPDLYDRFNISKQLEPFCKERDILFINTLPDFIRRSRDEKKMFHFKYDGHPDEEGHRIIADRIRSELGHLFDKPAREDG